MEETNWRHGDTDKLQALLLDYQTAEPHADFGMTQAFRLVETVAPVRRRRAR